MELKKKALIITGVHKNIEHLFPSITNRTQEELLTITSYGVGISDGYSCMMRNVILTIYLEGIEDIFIIGEKTSKEYSIRAEDILSQIERIGVQSDVIKTLNYIQAAGRGKDILQWLTGTGDIEEIIQKNIEQIKEHPLVPQSVTVHGFVVNTETSDYEMILSD